MKKIAFLCLFLCFTASILSARTVRFLSFNLNGNVSTHRQTNEWWVEEICSIIEQSDADVVLLQEVAIPLKKRADSDYFKLAKKNSLLDAFTLRLGENWAYFSTADYGLRKSISVAGEDYREGNMTQNNAVLYKKSVLFAVDWAEKLGFTAFNGDFLFDKNSVQVIEFRLLDSEKPSDSSFLLLNVHLPYTNTEHRMRDIATLERLYARYKLRYGILIGGDFNTPRSELATRNFDFVDGSESWYYDRNFGLKTTVSKASVNIFKLSKDYDHFVYNSRMPVSAQMHLAFSFAQNPSYKKVSLGNEIYVNSKDYAERISDHVPILLEVDW